MPYVPDITPSGFTEYRRQYKKHWQQNIVTSIIPNLIPIPSAGSYNICMHNYARLRHDWDFLRSEKDVSGTTRTHTQVGGTSRRTIRKKCEMLFCLYLCD